MAQELRIWFAKTTNEWFRAAVTEILIAIMIANIRDE